jgi:hypothetical protein
MTLKTLADVRVLVRHLPEDRRTQPAWPASPHSLSKQPRGVYGGKRRFGSIATYFDVRGAFAMPAIATQLLHCSEPLISLHRKLPAT